MNIKFLQIKINFVFTLLVPFFLLSCSSTGEKYFGIVEMFHNKPKPPAMVPRNIIVPMPAGAMSSHQINGILVMDSGSDYEFINSLTYLSNLLAYSLSDSKKSGDLPCHYFIDRDGIVYRGRNVISTAEIHKGGPYTLRLTETSKQEVAYARLARKRNPTYDLDGYILICVLGDYDSDLLLEKQEQSLYQLIAYLVYQNNIALERIFGLRSLFQETKNPGFYLNNYVQTSILQENIPPPPGEHRFLTPESQASVW